MSVDASISNMYMLEYGHGWAGALGGSRRVVHDVHMSTAFLGTKAHSVKHLSAARASQSEAALA